MVVNLVELLCHFVNQFHQYSLLLLIPLQDAAKARLQYPSRPEPLEDVAKQPEVTARNFPESVDKIPLTMS